MTSSNPDVCLDPRRDGLPARGLDRRRSLAFLLSLGLPLAQAQTELTDLARIRASGVLKVAVYKDNAPFSDGPTDNMQGLDIDLAGALARQLQLKLALLPFDAGERMNDDLRNMVWRGHYLGYGPADIMLHVPVDKYLMQENRQALIFAPYMRQVQVLLHDTRTLPQVTGPDDLKGHKLAVERGTGMASVLMGQQNGMLQTQVSLYPSGVEAAQAVIKGQAAAAYVLRSQAEAALAGAQPRPAHLALTSLPLEGVPENGWPLGLAIKAANKDLGQALEVAFRELRSNGELLAMFQKRGMTLTAP
ncbi:transporter substrate-binding domain-containing protein [Polaromonas sp.]|uniref:substrate-binding periplasmic protein n=1 Tax=Polaromonas sp. TaxID=1869339 RepID=UPI0013B6FB0C|nr:transporter substrate-binding domain-containing protein [Polaromonas sp.]NDP64760.1 amino acid ABC transporter substrate-binding protein [Polaromonas sp.]